MTLIRLLIDVEKLVISTQSGDMRVSADMDGFELAKMRVTWNFLVMSAMLASQDAMPFNRLAELTSSATKSSAASEISPYYTWTAARVVSFYIHLGQSLAHAAILLDDDTQSLVLQVANAQKKMTKGASLVSPRADCANAQAAQSVDEPREETLAVRLACAFGLAAQRALWCVEYAEGSSPLGFSEHAT